MTPANKSGTMEIGKPPGHHTRGPSENQPTCARSTIPIFRATREVVNSSQRTAAKDAAMSCEAHEELLDAFNWMDEAPAGDSESIHQLTRDRGDERENDHEPVDVLE